MSSPFSLVATANGARAGVLLTAHGVVETPVFMPIATSAAVKTMTAEEVQTLGATVILGNTYHLLLRPGADQLKRAGGMHGFMRWSGPILTDSGGYQVFSLSKINKTDEDGVTFQSHLDGASIRLTPESSLAMQAAIGSDIMMQFDDVAAGNSTYERYEEAMERSLRWAARSKDGFAAAVKHRALLFGIVQGGVYEDLRRRSVAGLTKLGFDGYAIGGLSVGESREDTFRIAKTIAAVLPANTPRYFMGGGMPEEIVYYVSVGIDMFDCVLPTRNARHGQIFIWKSEPADAVREALQRAREGAADFRIAECLYDKLQITSERTLSDFSPIDRFSDCETSQHYSKAYLRHLFKTGETLGLRLATAQNLRFYLRLMEELRKIVRQH